MEVDNGPLPPPPPSYLVPEEYVEHFAAVEDTVATINAESNFFTYELLQVDRESDNKGEAQFRRDRDGNSCTAKIYPYGSGQHRIVTVTLVTSSYNFCGITVDDSPEAAIAILLQHGFELTYENLSSTGRKLVYSIHGPYGIDVVLNCNSDSTDLEKIHIYVLDSTDPFRDDIV